MEGAHAAQHARLEQVGVLVFVHEHVLVQSGDARLQFRRRLEHECPEQQQVVVVHEVALLLAERVIREQRRDLLLVFEEVRHVAVEQLVQGEFGVDVARVEPVERFLFRKALGRLGEPHRPPRELHEVLGVALVHDGEIAREAGGGPELAQQPVAYRVEGAAVHAGSRRPHEALGAREHFRCGAAGEGEEEDAFGGHSPIDEGGHAVNQRPGLAGAGTGDDQEWGVAECDRARLVRVERGGNPLFVRSG